MQQLEADYLVIGCGAVSMAFVDTLLSQSDATFVIVDDRHMPGGHWNDAYPFVRLHQPSAFYGVESTPLGSQRIDESGSNKGFYEMATGAEVSAYFEKVMRERFLTSNRVQYFPMCSYKGDNTFESRISSAQYSVTVNKRVVDGTFYKTSVPATHQRKYSVADDVECIIPNELPRKAPGFKRYTVVGGGKTGMDSLIWLLDNSVDPNQISWVCPRDSWLINRSTTQPGVQFFKEAIGGFANQLKAMAEAESVEDLFEKLESVGAMLRIDQQRTPEMFHYATISQGEVDQLRRVKDVMRNGRISSIDANNIVFANGETRSVESETLYIDCTATAVEFSVDEVRPVFSDKLITLQALRAPLVTYSAAVAAYVEANVDTDAEKNKLCSPVMLADNPAEYLGSFVGNMMNQKSWTQHKPLRDWSNQCRLNPFGATISEVDGTDEEQMRILGEIRSFSEPAVMNLFSLMAKAQAKS